MEFKGSIVALVTPFTGHGVDESKLAELVEFQIKNGTRGIVPCGTTGESPTLSHEEHDRVIENGRHIWVEVAAGQVRGSPNYRFILRTGAVREVLEHYRPDVIESLSHSLGRRGYDVETAQTGEEGIEKVKLNKFDVVSKDWDTSGH